MGTPGMGFPDTTAAVRDHVSPKYRVALRELQGGGDLPPPLGSNIQPNTVLVKEAGLYELIFSSKMKKAWEFRDWVFGDVTSGYPIPRAALGVLCLPVTSPVLARPWSQARKHASTNTHALTICQKFPWVLTR